MNKKRELLNSLFKPLKHSFRFMLATDFYAAAIFGGLTVKPTEAVHKSFEFIKVHFIDLEFFGYIGVGVGVVDFDEVIPNFIKFGHAHAQGSGEKRKAGGLHRDALVTGDNIGISSARLRIMLNAGDVISSGDSPFLSIM